jgi:hypothetical protein
MSVCSWFTEAFASEPVKLKIMGCCSQSSNSNNLTVQWGSPLRGNVSIIGYVVELQQLKWDTCNTTNAMPVAAKWFKTQNLTINRDGMETICLPKCVIESDSDQDTSTDDDIGLFQQLANLRYNKKNVSVRQGNIEETNKRISRSINDTSAVITELQPFFAYKVRVRAQTEAGWGPWSSELVAFTAPSYNSDRVVNLSANVIDETRVNITWSKPQFPNGNVVRSYCLEVRWRYDDGLRWATPNLTLSNDRDCGSSPIVNGVVKFTLHDQRESQIIPLTVQERPGYDTNVDFSVTVNSYFPWENQSSLLHPIETVNFTMPGVINSSDLGLVIGICVASVLAAVLLVAVVVTGVYVRRVKYV